MTQNQKIDPAFEQLELDILNSGCWGTIGPHSLSAAAALATYVGAGYGLVCHSAGAAYESLLRAFGCAHGDKIVTAGLCSPAHVLAAVCTGAAPVFAEGSAVCNALPSPDSVDRLLTDTADVRAVVTDFPCALCDTDAYPLDELAAVCRAHKVPLIIDAAGFFSAKWRGEPPVRYAEAVVYDMGEGSEIYAGMGGLVATDSLDTLNGAFAYHNCGRGITDGCSLNFDAIVGGDLRVSEWTAAAAELTLALKKFSDPVAPVLEPMYDQPLYGTAYYKKMTGC